MTLEIQVLAWVRHKGVLLFEILNFVQLQDFKYHYVRLVNHMFSISLDCPFLIVLSVFSNVYSQIWFVICTFNIVGMFYYSVDDNSSPSFSYTYFDIIIKDKVVYVYLIICYKRTLLASCFLLGTTSGYFLQCGILQKEVQIKSHPIYYMIATLIRIVPHIISLKLGLHREYCAMYVRTMFPQEQVTIAILGYLLFFTPKHFKIILLSKISILSVPDEGYS